MYLPALSNTYQQVERTSGYQLFGLKAKANPGLHTTINDTCEKLHACLMGKRSGAINVLKFFPVLKNMAEISNFEVESILTSLKTNHVLIENELLKVVLIHWKPGSKSSIHGHPKGGGFFKVLQGNLEEIRYSVNNAKPKLLDVQTHTKGAIGYIDDQFAYHAVGNPFSASAISLHAYIRTSNINK